MTPCKRYQWTVLLQGMKNSPPTCQWYVAKALSPVWEQFPQMYCYHYMGDILVPAANKAELQQVYPVLQQSLVTFTSEKIQQQALWKYLGVKVLDQTLEPQYPAPSKCQNPK